MDHDLGSYVWFMSKTDPYNVISHPVWVLYNTVLSHWLITNQTYKFNLLLE